MFRRENAHSGSCLVQDLDINPARGDLLRAPGGSASLEAGRLGSYSVLRHSSVCCPGGGRLSRVVTLLALEPQSPALAHGLAAVLQMWRETGEYTQAEMTED